MRFLAPNLLVTALVLLLSVNALAFNVGDKVWYFSSLLPGTVGAITTKDSQELLTVKFDEHGDIHAPAGEFMTAARVTAKTETLIDFFAKTHEGVNYLVKEPSGLSVHGQESLDAINLVLVHEIHKKYVKKNISKLPTSSTEAESITIEYAFTLISRDKKRMITYLPEIHLLNSPASELCAQIIGWRLSLFQQKIFIESSGKMHGARGQALKELLLKYVGQSSHHGIVGNLPAEASLEPLEAGGVSAEESEYLRAKQEEAKWRACGLSVTYSQDTIKKLEQAANKSRDAIQGRVLDEEAPEGHSWAVGGSGHASGVKTYLLGKGWTEVVL